MKKQNTIPAAHVAHSVGIEKTSRDIIVIGILAGIVCTAIVMVL